MFSIQYSVFSDHIVGLVGLRYLVDFAVKSFGLNAGGNLVQATDATLIFSTSMLVARSAHTWIRARALIDAHRQSALSAGECGPRQEQPGA